MIERLRFRLAMWISPYDALAYRLHVRGLDFVSQPDNLAIVECHIDGAAEMIPLPYDKATRTGFTRTVFQSDGGSLDVDGVTAPEGVTMFDLEDTDLDATNLHVVPKATHSDIMEMMEQQRQREEGD